MYKCMFSFASTYTSPYKSFYVLEYMYIYIYKNMYMYMDTCTHVGAYIYTVYFYWTGS